MSNNDAFAITFIIVMAVRLANKVPEEDGKPVIDLVEGIVKILEDKGYLK